MYGFAGRLAHYFIDSKLTPIIVLVSLALGAFAIITTPKEEEPQIIVPMIDIYLSYPGASPQEVERRVVEPLEKKLWELKDIEYLYSASSEGQAIVTARFYVGTDPVKALVDLNTKMMSAMDVAPPGVSLPPLIKPKSIDDVPIVTLTLWGKNYDWYDLRKFAAVLETEIKKINNVADVFIVGGRPRELRVVLDPQKLEYYRVSPLYIAKVIQAANSQLQVGTLKGEGKEYLVKTGDFIKSKEDLENLVVGVFNGRPVFLRDVAKIEDGPSDIKDYVLMGFGPKYEQKNVKGVTTSDLYPAVTIAVAKRKGTNAVDVAEEILKVVEHVKGTMLPSDLNITVTRNYGETAKEKADELIKKLFIATFSVVLLIAVTLGFKEAIVVAIAVPVTLALALFLSELLGFTLNRVTLFALIFSIGILVDDAIVVVENIHRWFELQLAKTPREAIVRATDEVGNPTILATFTVIAALMPMAFVSGLMGPYMRPIPINSSSAMLFSLFVAFMITPWASYIFLRDKFDKAHEEHKEIDIKSTVFWKIYSRIMVPLLTSKAKRYALYTATILLLLGSVSLLVFKVVLVKMLPYDNKSEVQIVIDMPEDATLERTLQVAKAIGEYISKESIVTDYQIYVGTSAPFNFNGLVRHYYLRQAPYYADIQVNLIPKDERKEQSHDFAKRIRPKVEEIARRYGVKYVAVVEVPPGPPVLSPIVAEVYAPDFETQQKVAKEVLKIFRSSPAIVDSGIYLEDPVPTLKISVDEYKAKMAGLTKEEVVQTLAALIHGYRVDVARNTATENTPIVIRLEEKYRTLDLLKTLKIPTRDGRLVALSDIVQVKEEPREPTIYRKNLRRVIYVIGDAGGREEAPFYGIFAVRSKVLDIPNPYGPIKELWMSLPLVEDGVYVKWDGEMHITLEVFRDLGLAFAVALFIMYVLILGWFKDFKIPGIIMAPIPLTLVGIIPGHALLGAFFTATSMIGFIALAGIIVRNSILLVDFAEERIKQGVPIHLAVVESGVIRTRPILLTAVALIVGSFVILFDPIFNGLAVSLIFGTIGSTALTLVLIPVMYYASKTKKIEVPSPEEIQRDILR